MQIRVRLDQFLANNNLSPSRLASSLRGEVSQTAVYALCRADKVKRLDLHTLAGVLGALRLMTGKDVRIDPLLEEVEDGAMPPHLRQGSTAPPANRIGRSVATPFDDQDDEADNEFWERHREAQRRLEEKRRG